MVEAVDFFIVAQEGKKFHAQDAVDEEQSTDEEEDEARTRQDDGDGLDDFPSEGDVVEH